MASEITPSSRSACRRRSSLRVSLSSRIPAYSPVPSARLRFPLRLAMSISSNASHSHWSLRALRESNPRRRFWRPKLYHLTKRPYESIVRRLPGGDKPLLLFPLFVNYRTPAPVAVLLVLELFSDKFSVLPRPIVGATALRTCECNELILRHAGYCSSESPLWQVRPSDVRTH